MTMRKYPIGIQTFANVVNGEWFYVDKTDFVAKLTRAGKFFFLSRPRRFGKSLLLSTLHAYFEGKRNLFKGLKLDSMDVDWTPSPVLHFDFNTVVSTDETGLEAYIINKLAQYEKEFELSQSADSLSVRFGNLIQAISKQTGRPVAILVDEYDKPLLGLEPDSELYIRRQALMKGFFGNLKSMEQYIRFAMLTGVARFSKVSIFSDLNNLKDISLDNEFADICGWTEEELVDTFRQGIEKLAEKNREDFDTTLGNLRNFYDGYRFAEEGSRLYNPFSVLNALSSCKVEPYWFETGTPTFLAKRVKEYGIDLPSLNEQWATRDQLLTVGLGSKDPVPLLFQTGYLTIGDYDDETGGYLLRFPNREVQVGFAKFLLPLYIPEATELNSEFQMTYFQRDLVDGRPEDFMCRIQTLLAGESYHCHSESQYQSELYLIFNLAGARARMETHTSNGRTDIEIKTRRFIYIFELKYNRSVEEAMAQIHERDYAQRFQLDSRTIFLIGANFVDREGEHGLQAWEIQQLK